MEIFRISFYVRAAAVLALLLAPATVAAQDASGEAGSVADDGLPEGVVAIVNGEEISVEAFQNFYKAYVTQTYFHYLDKSRRDEIAIEALDLLVSDTILVQEVERLGVEGDVDATQKRMEAFEKRFARDEESRKEFEANRENLREEILADTKIQSLRDTVMAGAAPTEEEVRTFYKERSDLFTTPPAVDLSIILLPVPPHGVTDEWKAAEEKGDELHARLVNGEDFATLAKEFSGHESSEDGGALGLVHDGQLIEEVATVLDELEVGAFSEPIRILEGVAIFKINGRNAAQPREFESVRERAAGLLERETANKRWNDYLETLRANARIKKTTSPVRFLRDS